MRSTLLAHQVYHERAPAVGRAARRVRSLLEVRSVKP